MKGENIGSSFDSFLREEGIYEEVSAAAIKRVVARQVERHASKRPGILTLSVNHVKRLKDRIEREVRAEDRAAGSRRAEQSTLVLGLVGVRVIENPPDPVGARAGIVLVGVHKCLVRFPAVTHLAFVISNQHVGRNARLTKKRLAGHFSGHNLNVGRSGSVDFHASDFIGLPHVQSESNRSRNEAI